jgi:TusA-related sulfurtransferase
MIQKINPKRLIIQHGDEAAVEEIRKWAEQQGKYAVYAPAVGDEIEI